MRLGLAAAGFLLAAMGAPTDLLASKDRWVARIVGGAGPISEVRPADGGRVFIRAKSGWLAVKETPRGFCSVKRDPPKQIAMPKGGLPDGEVAAAAALGIKRAWYAKPTTRYAHGVIGDRVEAGALIVIDGEDRRHQITLPKNEVFEDRFPRLADLDGDGVAEIVSIVSSQAGGGSVRVYALDGGKLVPRSDTLPIGRTNRWLNPVGIADFNGDGHRDVALVETPHIGGMLQIWSVKSPKAQLIDETFGFSNHWIGSRILRVSGLADIEGDGLPELFVPSADRQALRIMRFKGTLMEAARVELPGAIDSALGLLISPHGPPTAVLTDRRGRLVLVTSKTAKAKLHLYPCS